MSGRHAARWTFGRLLGDRLSPRLFPGRHRWLWEI
jgi:hypothetical protein